MGFRREWMMRYLPYVLTGWNGSVMMEHREYRPVGNPLPPVTCELVIPAGALTLQEIDTTAGGTTGKTEHCWLYNDGCPPWASSADWRRYCRTVRAVFRERVPTALSRVMALEPVLRLGHTAEQQAAIESLTTLLWRGNKRVREYRFDQHALSDLRTRAPIFPATP